MKLDKEWEWNRICCKNHQIVVTDDIFQCSWGGGVTTKVMQNVSQQMREINRRNTTKHWTQNKKKWRIIATWWVWACQAEDTAGWPTALAFLQMRNIQIDQNLLCKQVWCRCCSNMMSLNKLERSGDLRLEKLWLLWLWRGRRGRGGVGF